jgi:PKD repeat protein
MKTKTMAQKNGQRSFLPVFCIVVILVLALPAAVGATAPVANFSATPVTGNSPLTVTFTDASVNATSWAWDFGDGGTSTVQNPPAHIYLIAGNYTVKLTATNGDGSNSTTRTNYITAQCNLGIGGIPVPNYGPATLFANENNTITVTQVKNTVGNSPATELLVNASDGWSARVAVPAMNSTGSMTLTVVDPTIRTTAGVSVTYTAIIDPDNTVPETSEIDNTKTSTKTVTYNGYKGVQYWNGKTAPSTYLTYDIHGDVIHSFGDSYYKSGKGSNWQTLTWHWNATELPVPAGATVKAVRLYLPYCWDYEHEIWNGLTTTTFNGVTITPVHKENDTSNFGTYAQYEYGLVTYDVTGLYVKNDNNTATFTRTYWNYNSPLNPGQPGSLSPAGFTLAVIYEDQNATRRQIFINEGWDLLGASTGDYGTTEDEATSYQAFTGMTIDMGTAVKANLTTFVPWGAPQNTGDTGEGNLFVNSQQVGHNVWNYGISKDVWGENGLPQVAVDTRDVLSYLKAGGTGNGIAIQSTAGASPCMVAERSFLVVEYPVTAPVANFTATPVSGAAPLKVYFTDTSTNGPTSWAWNFGDGNTTNATVRNPVHTYAAAGNYTVTLTATNSAGSNAMTRTNYITVTNVTVVALPGNTNLPKDLNGDGLYEDLNGNNRKDVGDVVLFIDNIIWVGANEPVSAFDFNHNGRIDVGDVIVRLDSS